jgi:hypothetical protein
MWADFRVEKKSGPGDARRQFLEKLDPLFSKRELKRGKARDIAARPRQALNKALADRIADTCENDRYCACRLLQRRDTRRSDGKYHFRPYTDQFRRVKLYAFRIGTSPMIIDLQVAAFAPAPFLHPLPECHNASLCLRIVYGHPTEHADPPHAIGLLSTRRHRPRRCAPDPRDELPPSDHEQSRIRRWLGGQFDRRK